MALQTSCSIDDNSQHSKSISAFQKALDKVSKYNATLLKARSNSSSKTNVDVTPAYCLITLCKVLDNILLERQYNPKTRSIKLGNKLFRDRVGKVPGGGKISWCFLIIRSKRSLFDKRSPHYCVYPISHRPLHELFFLKWNFYYDAIFSTQKLHPRRQ